MPSSEKFVSTAVLSLDGDWLLATDPQNVGTAQQWWTGPTPGAKPTRVPWIIQDAFPEYHGVAWYWREFTAPDNPHAHGRALLRFWAVDYKADVWLNGAHVGGHEGGETPFSLDVTGAIKPQARNLLAVRVLNPTTERIDGMVLGETPHRNKAVPHYVGGSYNYGGIMESVELLITPAVRVEDLFVQPDPKTGTIRIQATVRNTLQTAVQGHLQFTVAPAATGETLAIARVEHDLPPGDTRIESQVQVAHPRLWDLSDPYLYRVTARVWTTDSESVDEYSVRCGFRDFRVVNGYFRLNGKRVFVRSTHTGNHYPVGQVIQPDGGPDLLRRDLVYAKASGFNMVRFIAGMAHPWQLDACDEIGLMVYEESLAGWCLQDSPEMGERFDLSIREMVLRDRNHPSVVIWGLLNETRDGAVFQHAQASLPLVRSLDDTRLVLLGSGRWDCQPAIGSVSNPGSSEWEHVWGIEASGAPPVSSDWDRVHGGYFDRAGDAHVYPPVPHPPNTIRFIRTLGHDTKPVFLSEYGIGSVMNAVRELRLYEQSGLNLNAEDAALMRSMAEKFTSDWHRFGLDGVYPFPEDMLRESQRLHARQRLLGFDLIRSNPKICGYNLTGMLDHGMTGEGVWTFWREWKPGVMDAMMDGWAPLRWCLFIEPLHGYADRPLMVEAVLANEDVLQPGDYPVCARLVGPAGVVWEKRTTVRISQPAPGEDGPLAIPVLREEVRFNGPAGVYELAVTMERGGGPAGGRLRFYVSDAATNLARINQTVTLWGIEERVERWLVSRGVRCERFWDTAPGRRQVILVGDVSGTPEDPGQWKALMERVAQGSTAVFLSPAAFKRGEDAVGWLPLANKGRCYAFHDWLYHKECVATAHPVFDGLQARGIMDWDYYGPIIPRYLFDGQDTPDDVAAAAFALGYPCPGGYASGILMGSYPFGAGRFVLNTLRILENLDAHPAADRLLLNMINEAARGADKPVEMIPEEFEERLRAIGYAR